ncbi:uncharacterized protein LOC123559987 [Mercenaria mercenaria]|uniref:uncharacterized protein LOC123559987 n=1 Tax=Mercenaria mercenaria TaxID=6596 RepID=UPI00234F6CA3|nr:uncharacterized protein LOC123559987 [Mercenaria mercenaria]
MDSYQNMERGTKPHEIFVENTQLREQNKELQRQQQRLVRRQSAVQRKTGNKCLNCVLKPMVKSLILCFIIVAAIISYSVLQVKQNSTLKSLISTSSGKQTDSKSPEYAMNLEIGQQISYLDCTGSQLKQSFPDLDYAILGYNILKGYPLAVGHDPGFTYPIFKADYAGGLQTADCRYSVPKGLVVVSDVSCITSFSSTTIQTKYEFSRALSVYTKVSGGTWGTQFSASVGYKSSSSDISSGESVYILSTAKCNYYFSKLVTEDAPQFDDVFIKWVHKLNAASSDPELYFKFFEIFGTHFATEVTFGARYTYEYKMSSNYYETEREKGVDVKTVASTSGFFGLWNLEGEFQVSLSQRQKASEFRQSVETKTTTVGAPPPEDGGAMAWASEVKTNPVPSAYKLVSIENLFTDKYMKSLNVDFSRIYKNIVSQKMKYCLFLQNKGELESCEELVAGIELKNTRIIGHYREKAVSSVSDCIEICLEEIHCEAVSFCTTCTSSDIDYNTCHLIQSNGHSLTTSKTEETDYVWQSNVFPGKIRSQLKLENVGIIGVLRGFETEEDKKADLQKCRQLCFQDAYCTAYSYCNCTDTVSKCKMYSKELTTGLQTEANIDTFFISASLDSITSETTATTAKTN